MINDVRPLRFWCQKVLPLVYDNSLSYYEVLCKIVAKINELINFIDVNIEEMVKEVIEEYYSEITYRESDTSINFNVGEENQNA